MVKVIMEIRYLDKKNAGAVELDGDIRRLDQLYQKARKSVVDDLL